MGAHEGPPEIHPRIAAAGLVEENATAANGQARGPRRKPGNGAPRGGLPIGWDQ